MPAPRLLLSSSLDTKPCCGVPDQPLCKPLWHIQPPPPHTHSTLAGRTSFTEAPATPKKATLVCTMMLLSSGGSSSGRPSPPAGLRRQTRHLTPFSACVMHDPLPRHTPASSVSVLHTPLLHSICCSCAVCVHAHNTRGAHRRLANSMPAVTHASSGSACRARVAWKMAVASARTRPCLHL